MTPTLKREFVRIGAITPDDYRLAARSAESKEKLKGKPKGREVEDIIPVEKELPLEEEPEQELLPTVSGILVNSSGFIFFDELGN